MSEIPKKWPAYIKTTRGAEPSPLLGRALQHVISTGAALDLGAGALNETKLLLEKGFAVTAVDQEPLTCEIAGEMNSPKLTCITVSFENFDFPREQFDLVCSINALSFAQPADFGRIASSIRNSLKPGGVFCGQLFGTKHSWSYDTSMTFFTEPEARAALDGLEIIEFREWENDGKTQSGDPVHWHTYIFIARKPG